jgi:hypothetical protein
MGCGGIVLVAHCMVVNCLVCRDEVRTEFLAFVFFVVYAA